MPSTTQRRSGSPATSTVILEPIQVDGSIAPAELTAIVHAASRTHHATGGTLILVRRLSDDSVLVRTRDREPPSWPPATPGGDRGRIIILEQATPGQWRVASLGSWITAG
jgi:hypothetical protein